MHVFVGGFVLVSKEQAVDTGMPVVLTQTLFLTSPRAAKVADRASSEPADCDWV